MRIIDIRETTVSVGASIRNADIGYDTMTASAVAVISDQQQDGHVLIGLGFDSIGRYGHGGLLRERFIPRLLAASPEQYAAADSNNIDPVKAWDVVMRDEKPGGHGDRAGAVGVLDAALWDLAAKAEDKPLWRVLGERYYPEGHGSNASVYATGGHYREADDLQLLQDELRAARDAGHRRFKIKVGGATTDIDRRRLDAAMDIVEDSSTLAVDANAIFDKQTAFEYLGVLRPYELAWIEEPAGPLDYPLYAELAANYSGSIATGENLFSAADLNNLLRYAGLRPQTDFLQMDISLSYGIPEYLRMIAVLESAGWSRKRCLPHAGHLLAVHAVAGLGLGAHETTIDTELPFGGFTADTQLNDGNVVLGETPGVGIEAKPEMYALFSDLLP